MEAKPSISAGICLLHQGFSAAGEPLHPQVIPLEEFSQWEPKDNGYLRIICELWELLHPGALSLHGSLDSRKGDALLENETS